MKMYEFYNTFDHLFIPPPCFSQVTDWVFAGTDPTATAPPAPTPSPAASNSPSHAQRASNKKASAKNQIFLTGRTLQKNPPSERDS